MANYVCSKCGRSSRLPDVCCGKAMVTEGSYMCPNCGKVSPTPGECCSDSMVQVSSR